MAETRTQIIGIIGAGTMGSGIALVALRAGFKVILTDITQSVLDQAQDYIKKHLIRKNQEALLSNLTLTPDLKGLSDSNVVIEAASENLDLKQTLFKQLDEICPPPTILATNTSTLPVTAIAAATTTPERVGGLHFFNPPAVLPLVEVTHTPQLNPAILQVLVALAGQLGKKPVVTRDTPGFIVNRVARPFYGEALRLLGEGVATHDQIDQIVQFGGGFRMGPFQLMDLIGIDINFAATQSMYEQTFHEPRYRPHWLQQQKVQQNHLGKKTGHGFYNYTKGNPELPTPPDMLPASGSILISEGGWAPGLDELCEQAGYVLQRKPKKEITVGLVIAGREEDLQKQVHYLDQLLLPNVPLLCQASDTNLTEIATWVKNPQRLVGFDGLFIAQGRVATLVASPVFNSEIHGEVESFCLSLGRLPVWVQDSPSLVLPRIVCMLANEAAFAAGEGVAKPDQIDEAMLLGVNYPKGPMAWAEEIGYDRVVTVLEHLEEEYREDRYRVAPLLRRLARLEQLQNVT